MQESNKARVVSLDAPAKKGALETTQHQVDLSTSIPIIEEFLIVEKHVVDHGGYKISKIFETHEESINELLNDQNVEITRVPLESHLPVNSMLPASRYEGDTLIIPVVKEILVTEKRFVLVEEIHIKKVQSSHYHQEIVKLQKEIVEVEAIPSKP